MPSAEPTRLTDDFWLAAHDSVHGKPQIGETPLGVGLATGLLAELIHDGHLELRQGELFRTTAEPPADAALSPLLAKMDAEEERWLPTPRPTAEPIRARAPVDSGMGRGRPPWPQDDPDWSPQGYDSRGWPPQQDGRDAPTAHDSGNFHTPWKQGETRHRRRGHQLTTWMAYLAYERRAEQRVIDRLSRTGLVRRYERRRLLGGTTVNYVPIDSVVSGSPANTISNTVQSERVLSRRDLFLAGLFLATGLHHHALAALSPFERSQLAGELKRGLDEMSRKLLRAADVAVGEAAMR